MGRTIERILLWLFVINLGIALGAGLYEARIQVPEWLVSTPGGLRWDAEASLRANTGLRFWAFVTTGPLTLLTLASLGLVWGAGGAARDWWLLAISLTVVERIATFAYFIPTMVRLQAAGAGAQVQQTLGSWATANYVRHALNLAAWLCALQALRAFE